MKNYVCTVLGKNIKRIRKIKGLKQDELAERLGLEVKSLSLVETGNGFVSAKTLEKLISVLDVPLTELFDVQDKENVTFLYEQVLNNLEHIKNNSQKLNTVLLVLKSLV